MYNFLLLNTIFLLITGLLIFLLLGKYITKPILKLVKEVKNIDLGNNNYNYNKLPILGSFELTFLRSSINNLINRIEHEQSEVRKNEEKLLATLLSVGDGVITIAVNNTIQFLNPIAETLTGWKLDKAINSHIDTVFKIEIDSSSLRKETSIFESQNIVNIEDDVILISKNGVKKSIEGSVSPIYDKYNNIIGRVIVFRDISEKKEKQKKIKFLSYHDQLTGLHNRRYFDEKLELIDREENLPIAFIYADVNGLKLINDAFGHHNGDQVIKTVANVFKNACINNCLISRIGGDEFIIVLLKADSNVADKVADYIRKEISKRRIMDINISLSLGISIKTSINDSIQNIIKVAEDIMYQKKLTNSASKSNVAIRSILNALLVKNPREKEHSQRVGYYCKRIGEEFYLNDDEINELETAGVLHDIGKIAIDEKILNKTSSLTPDEWSQIKKHPETGFRLLGSSSEFYKISEFVLEHHERWDGKGYPKGLKGEEIQWKSRVISIADAFDAMTCDRPYRATLTELDAAIILNKNAGKQFDPNITKIFIENVLYIKL